MKIMQKSLVIIGPMPPPHGRISIHINRLSYLLRSDYKITNIDESRLIKPDQFNVRSLNLLSYLKTIAAADIIHVHSGIVLFRFFHFIIAKLMGKSLIVTYHSFAKRKVTIWDKLIVKYSNKIICVSKEIANKLNIHEKLVKEAFLPPNISSEIELPLALSTWIGEMRKQHYIICCANASKLASYNGDDLYGLDLCIESAKILKERQQKVAFIFVVSDKTGDINVNVYKENIKDSKLNGIFYICEEAVSFVRLIEKSDLVLRPTNTDGDALTIREGLFFNKAVIASDVVVRPKGVRLFQSRSAISLSKRIEEYIYDSTSNGLSSYTTGNEYDYLDFYKVKVYSI